MEIKWLSDEEIKGSLEEFLKKFDAGELDGSKDFLLFGKAMHVAGLQSQASDDEDKQEFAEVVADDIEDIGSLAIFNEVRGCPDQSYCVMTDENGQKTGTWSGEYEPGTEVKNYVYMEMTPECATKICKGDPNTDPEFFSGDLTVKGSLRLAQKPRSWIECFFEFIEREPE